MGSWGKTKKPVIKLHRFMNPADISKKGGKQAITFYVVNPLLGGNNCLNCLMKVRSCFFCMIFGTLD